MVLVGIGTGQDASHTFIIERQNISAESLHRKTIMRPTSRRCPTKCAPESHHCSRLLHNSLCTDMLIMSFGLPRLSLRIFPDATGSMWKANIKDIGGEVLCVSQFTLLANTQKGNKPDFHRAMASSFFDYFCNQLGHPFIHPVFFNPSSSHSSQATEPSRRLYATFLERMGQVYEPDKIKGAPSHIPIPCRSSAHTTPPIPHVPLH